MKPLSEKIKQNLERVSSDIKPYNAKIVAVTKYYGKDEMMEVYRQGLRDFGESRAVESIEKINSLDEEVKSKSTYHFIGHLQTNKAKKVVGVFDYIHSVDSVNLAKELATVAQNKGIIQKIFIQVNNAFEEQKFGIAPSQLNNILNEIQKLKNLEVVGLMNIAPFTDDEFELHKLFREIYKLKEEFQLKELSMGMSHDYKIALEEGATIVRLGKILFE
ncbi:MAG: YggS family pyridoxal phosphate-dependent enzyme [Cyanobacteria bacterium SIG30]|nr:YggS family pyridoxal phosphate-dependent enzyme [Cyanobacteria bacterium SIG30]